MADPSSDRKERVIHTRVAEDLDEEIKRRAHSLGVSVSNLVRNILQNTIGLVEEIALDGAEAMRAARRSVAREDDRSASSSPQRPGRVIGWQSAVLAVNALCERCNAILPRGTRAGIALLDGPGAPVFRCEPCLEEIRSDAGTSTPDE
ncbi:MAG: hypothetical protein IT386_09340 [Deltaproteobacteria bacterium]|nr:hypothetical protein [Deltaproteobacteria bacterium]